jgi:hypothetical protein
MAISLQSTTLPTHAASSPTTWATRVATKHGLITVKSFYDAGATTWRHHIPSFSHAGAFRTVVAGACDCPARRQCWHECAAQEAERVIHEMLWSVLSYEFRLDASMESYWRGLATLQAVHIPSAGGYRATRAAAISAMEVLHV